MDVRDWLTHVENDFAEHHLQYEFVNAVTENGAPGPIFGLQTVPLQDPA
jgi:hypothetical protein